MSLVKRPEIIAFLNTTPSSTTTWGLIGNTMTDGTYTYDASTTSETYIVDDVATNIVDSYAVSIDGEMKCNKGDAVYDYINGLRYKLATGSDAETEILLIDKYDIVSTGTFKAQKFKCSVAISSYGGAGGETPSIGFTVSMNGNPIQGTATISSGVPTFTEATSA